MNYVLIQCLHLFTKKKGVSKAAQERCTLLEHQLTIAQDRLSKLQGQEIVDSVTESELAAREIALGTYFI